MKLVALEGLPPGAELHLGSSALVIGRALTCDLVLDDENVSREHCRIEPRDNGYVIEDLESHNGTIVNGLRIDRPVRLEPGDLVLIGRALLEVDQATTSPSLSLPSMPINTASYQGETGPRSAVQAGPAVKPAAPRLAQVLEAAVDAGRQLQASAGLASESLGRVESQTGGLSAALRRSDRAGGQREGRHLLAVCVQAGSAANRDRSGALLSSEVASFHRTITAALDLFEALSPSST